MTVELQKMIDLLSACVSEDLPDLTHIASALCRCDPATLAEVRQELKREAGHLRELERLEAFRRDLLIALGLPSGADVEAALGRVKALREAEIEASTPPAAIIDRDSIEGRIANAIENARKAEEPNPRSAYLPGWQDPNAELTAAREEIGRSTRDGDIGEARRRLDGGEP